MQLLGKEIEKFILKYKKEVVYLFILMIIGIIIHGYAMNNLLFYHDSVLIMNSYGTSIALGRWMLDILEKIFININGCSEIPMINSILSIWFISATSLVITKIFNIKDWTSKIYIGMVLIAFPTVSSIFAYMFTSHVYWLSCFLAAMFVYLNNKEEIRYSIISMLLLAISLGIYQSFISVAIVISLLSIIRSCLDNFETSKVIRKLLFYLIIGIGGVLLYVVATIASLKITGKHLGGYQGINSVGNSSLKDIIQTILFVYLDYFKSFWGGINETRTIRVITLVVILISFLITIAVTFHIENKKNVLISLICILLLPFGFNVMEVLSVNPETNVHTLMRYSLAFSFIFPVIILRDVTTKVSLSKYKKYGLLIFTLILWCFPLSYIYSDNRAYVKMDLLQEEAMSYYTTMVSQIKSTVGYSDEIPIAYVGAGNIEDLSMADCTFKDDVLITGYAYDLNSLVNDYAWKCFVKERLGFYQREVEELEQIYNLESVQKMPTYPKYGSIKIINNIIVVKLSDNY